MELSITEQNGRKVYIVVDNNGFKHEVTAEYVRFAIENGELDNYYINEANEIVKVKQDTFDKQETTATYQLLGRLLDEQFNLIGYLVKKNGTSKVLRTTIDAFNKLVKNNDIDGALCKKDGTVYLTFGVEEYQLVRSANGVSVPRKVVRTHEKISPVTMSWECNFVTVQGVASNLEKLLVRGTNQYDILGNGHKYPLIDEIRFDGIVLQIDGNKIPVRLMNRQDIINDITNYADIQFEVKQETVGVKITDIDYRMNSFLIVAAVYMTYLKLLSPNGKLTDIIISGTDRYYWSATISDKKSEVQHIDKILRKTKSDINIIQEMYTLEKSQMTADMTPLEEMQFVKGLKLGTCYIIINSNGCSFTSTDYHIDLIDKEVHIRFSKTGDSSFDREIAYKGKNVDNLNPGMVCIIAATAVAEEYPITTISICDSRTHTSYDFLFRPKNRHDRHGSLIDALN